MKRLISHLIALAIATVGLAPLAYAQTSSTHACEKVGVDNYPPTANDDYAAWTTATVTIDVLANDADVDHDPIVITSLSNITGGTAAIVNNGTAVQFAPAAGAAAGQFRYTISDGHVGHDSTATAYLTSLKIVDFSYSCQGTVCTFTAMPQDTNGIRGYQWDFDDGTGPVPWTGINIYKEFAHLDPGATHTYNVSLAVDYFSGERGVVTKAITLTGPEYDVTWRSDSSRGMTVSFWLLTSNLPSPTTTVRFRYYLSYPEEGTRDEFVGDPYASGFPFGVVINHQFPTPGDHLVRVETSREDLVNGVWVSSDPHTFGARTLAIFNAAPDANFSFSTTNGKTFSFDASQSHDDTMPFNATDYDFLWDFGDGHYGTGTYDQYQIPAPISHTYGPTGSYTVTLTIKDHRSNLSAIYTKSITVADAAPVPRISVFCKLTDCTFGSEASTDDNNNITGWAWTFPDGTTATGPSVHKVFAGAGCLNVLLAETDGTGHTSAPASQQFVVGPTIVAQAGGVTVDAHVQSFSVNGDVGTSDGNLNGIAEPGETVVVEPNGPATVPFTAVTGDVTLPGDPAGTTRNDDAQFLGNQAAYVVTNGKADCWAAGSCYAVRFPAETANNQHTGVHRDYVVQELDDNTNQPLAPITLHLGATFSDVTPSHWAYPFVESILHAGIDNGCGAGHYCPTVAFTRTDAAVWLLKGEHGAAYQPPACTTAPFTDVPCTAAQAAWIAQMKNEGIVSGTTFSPTANLTRADAAVYLLKAKLGASHVPPPCNTDYGDVRCPGNAAADWISEAKALGISNGCTATEYCPDDAVDRAQGAALVVRTFNLRIDGKQCVIDAAYDSVTTHPTRDPILSIAFAPAPAVVGSTSTGTITLGAPPAVNAVIPLSIDNAAATVPPSVVVPAYATTGTFTVTPANPAVRTPVNISATYRGFTKTAVLDICTPPPTISAQPGSVTINIGQSTTLSVTASGGGALTCQWYTGSSGSGTAINGATNATLTVTPGATTSYWVNVTNACSSRASNTATVTVCIPPSITAQPFSQIISYGTSAPLTVTAVGSGTLTYQWYEGIAPDTSKPVGTNSPSYASPILTANKSYWVRVTGTCNGTQTADSTTANITVVSQITRVQKASSSVQSLTSVTATWPQPTHAGNLLVAAISGAHSALVGNLNPPAGWQLATSYEWNNIKTLLYYYPNSPAGRTAETFTTATNSTFRDLVLQVAEYTWIATSSPLDKTNFDGDNAPRSGFVSSGTTGTTTQAAELVVTALSTYAATSFTTPTNGFSKIDEGSVPSDLTAALHERIVTTTGAYGHDAAVSSNVQWLGLIATFRGGSAPPLPIASLTFNPSPVTSGATSTGTITLSTAPSSTVSIPLTIDSAAASVPASVTVNAGQTIGTFTVTAGTVSTRTTTNVSATYLGYTITTALDVCPPAPTVTSQPTSRTINAGQSTTLSVAATGGGTLTYQWYAATAPSQTNPVGTGTSLTVTPSVTTNYWVSVSNGCGFTASNTATVNVCAPPVITTQPASQTIASGTSATLSVGINGSGPLAFQWYQGATGVTTTPVGTNSSTFNTPPLTTSTPYWVRVTSTCNGTVTTDSSTATVTVSTQITRVQTAAASAQSMTSVTATWPAATHAGNLLVAVFSAANNSTIGNFTAPAGWQLATTYEWTNVKTAIYYYPNAPVRTSETFSTASYRDQVLQLAEYASASQSAPLDKVVFNGDNAPAAGTVSTGTTATTSQANELVVTALATYAATSFTAPTNSFVKVQEQVVGNDLTAAYHERVVTSAGAYGHSATAGGNTQWVGAVATFKAAACSPAPSITAQPTSRTINSGQSTTFSVTASGGTLSYQWYQGSAPSTTTPVGTNSASLTVTPASTTNYWVNVTNACGSTASSTATVTVCLPAGIATQPASQTIGTGSSATVTVLASGSGPLSYQWYEGTSGTTTTPVGTNSSTFTTPALTASKSYWVRVISTCNGTTSVDSATATITVVSGIARVQTVAASAQSMTSVTATWPAATHAGNLLVAVFSAANNSTIGNFTAPSGWQLATSYEWNNVKTSIYYYPNAPARTSETFSTASFRDQVLQLAEYSGVVTATPLDRTAFDGAGAASGTVDSGTTSTTSQAKELLITGIASYSLTSFTAPTNSFSKLQEQSAGNDLTAAMFERIVTASGAYGHAASTSSTEQWVGLIATFKSAAP